MAIPTTKEITARNLANLESNLNQESPLNDKAFFRVLAGMEGLNHTELYKLLAERELQNLAISATGEDLDLIGSVYRTSRTPEGKAKYTVTLPATDGTVIKAGKFFTGDNNGVIYFVDLNATATGGQAIIAVTSDIFGVVGNLEVGDTMTLSEQIAGAETVATITSVDKLGADEESDESYRPRVLTVIRAVLGGGNATVYRIWGEEVAGVLRVYPYSGLPIDDPEFPGFPADRTVYVEAEASVDPDGIPTPAILDAVRESLNTDPTTGRSRPPLGLTDQTLSVEPIIRTEFFVNIEGLEVDPGLEAQAKADIALALDLYFRSIKPFVPGIDLLQDKDDKITPVALSDVIQDVLIQYGASATDVLFGTSSPTTISSYTLQQGEQAKPGVITYV